MPPKKKQRTGKDSSAATQEEQEDERQEEQEDQPEAESSNAEDLSMIMTHLSAMYMLCYCFMTVTDHLQTEKIPDHEYIGCTAPFTTTKSRGVTVMTLNRMKKKAICTISTVRVSMPKTRLV